MQNQTLSLTQEQRLQMILAPQLRQSLELLQAPVMELQKLIRAEAERNPTLEVSDSVPSEPLEVEPNVQRDSESVMNTAAPENGASNENEPADMDFSRELDILSRMDREESRYYFQHVSPETEERRQYRYDSIAQSVSLQGALMEQLQLSELDEEERQIGELLVGSIDDHGYLVSDPSELAESSGCSEAKLLRVLEVVRAFDPPGVGARDLRECLLLQLKRMHRQRRLEYRIVEKHLDLLAAHKFQRMARLLKTSEKTVRAASRFIATLHPRPGDLYGADALPAVVPEIIVSRRENGYAVELIDEYIPRLRISRRYEELLRDGKTSPDAKKYIAERIRAANYMIGSISQRQSTLRRIAEEVVRVQTPFFERGTSGLRPLTMARVAETVGVHETTVSRAASGKFVRTPRGVFELKYFFTTGIKKSGGQTVSNRYIQEQIADMVRRENKEHPLSDLAIVARLQQQGYRVSRRTVNKYRTLLKIPPSNLRRTDG